MATILFAVPVVIISCLILSWIESFFILPNHLSHFVKKPPGDRAESWMKVLRSQYKLMLNGVIRFRYLAAGVLTAIFILTGFIAAKEIQHDFKLSIGMESVTVFSFLKESHSLDETYAAIHGIEKGLYEILDSSEIDGVSTRVGSAWHDGREKSGYRYSRMRIYINKFDSGDLKDLHKLLFIEDEIIYKWYFDNNSNNIIFNTKVSSMLKNFKL